MMSPPDRRAFFFAIERPRPIPCFLNVIAGSNSDARAASLTTRAGVVHLDRDILILRSRDDEDRATGSSRIGSIFEQIGEDPFHEVGRRVSSRSPHVERQPILRSRMRGPEQRHPLADECVDVQHLRIDRWLAGKLRKRTDAALEDFDFTDDDLDRGVHEGTIARRLAGEHLLDSQANGSQRIFQLVGGLARERLPARHLRQEHQPFPALPKLVGHMVERRDGAPNFIVGSGVEPPIEVARGKSGQSGRQLLNGVADAVCDEDQRRK